jgi:putative tricarboxylic transport membrane protein
MSTKKMAKADFICSIIIIVFSFFMIYNCIIMPKYEEWGLYATPGLPPFIFSAILLIMGIILLRRSISVQGYKIRIKKDHLFRLFHSVAVRRFTIALSLVIFYSFLLGKIHFVIISTIYIFANIYIFKGAIWWINFIISIATSFTVWLLFEVIFLVPLP